MGKSRGGSVRSVQIEQDWGEIDEATTQQTVNGAIWDEIHRKWFYLAEQAPICQGSLRGDFGYTAFSPTAKKVWVSIRVWLGNMRTPRRMCTDTPDSAKAISCNDYSKTGMWEMMETSKGRHLVINVWSSFWTLQIRGSITNHLSLSCPQNKPLTM